MTVAPPSTALPLLRKLQSMQDRMAEIQGLLGQPEVMSNPARLVPLSKEAGGLEQVVGLYAQYQGAMKQVEELTGLSGGGDAEMAEMAASELPGARKLADGLLEQLKEQFVAAEDNAVESFFLEIRAGTGGEEAALFCRDLFEMYQKYCEMKGWKWDVSDFSDAERGGLKEVIINVKGSGAFRHLQFEGGGHRVQRVPETEGAGRIHTSAATVAVLPEMPDVKIEIAPKDVEQSGCRGGGPGGQNVNKVETGWQLHHKPSGLQFKMTEHKSQSQNKERAWALLRATLYERERAKAHAQQTSARKLMMGSGDRSQRIRTYNFPQNRCTDHRLGGGDGDGPSEKNFNLDQIMLGRLDGLVAALLELDKNERLNSL